MVQLKTVSMRLKSIKNIQKITKTMKMVSASKFAKAERELKAVRSFGDATRKFYEGTHLVEKVEKDEKGDDKTPQPTAPIGDKATEKNTLHIAVTSDRGLCGGVHSGVARRIRRLFETIKAADSPHHKIMCIGDKSRAILRRQFPNNILITVKEIGRTAPTFADASRLAASVADSDYQFDKGIIYYNKYFTPVKYELTLLPVFAQKEIEAAPNMNAYDDVEAEMLKSYAEFTLAALIYYVLKESAASEQSARMSAMDNATKNANDMIKKLTLLFNRTRQAVITRELIEIISGAAALN